MKDQSIFPILLSLCFYLFSCEAEIDLTPDKASAEKAPKFNFLVRQLESGLRIIDTTFINDTIQEADLILDSIPAMDTIMVIDTTVVMDTVKAELYLKQLDFTVEEEKYTLIVTMPENFDGLIHYKGESYRSGDWIEIIYKDLIEYTTIIQMTQHLHPGKPIGTGQYHFNLLCSDSKENSKSASLSVKVP